MNAKFKILINFIINAKMQEKNVELGTKNLIRMICPMNCCLLFLLK